MIFDDADLKRLKGAIEGKMEIVLPGYGALGSSILSLIARLEASEKVHVITHRCKKCGTLQRITGKFKELWLKASGRSK